MDFVDAISEGLKLADKWHDGPITYLGVQVAGFPNMLTLAGPQGASVSSNFPPCIEFAVDWATDLVHHLREQGVKRIEADAEAESARTVHPRKLAHARIRRPARCARSRRSYALVTILEHLTALL